VLVAPRSARLVEVRGALFTLLSGYAFCLLGFLTMLLLWKENIPYWKVGLGYAFTGICVGPAGTPASHSLTGSVPVQRAGMASGTADLQRDLGGAVMQSIFGALLTAGYAAAAGAAISASSENVSDSVQNQLTKSFAGAEAIAQQYPPSARDTIIGAAKTSFLQRYRSGQVLGLDAPSKKHLRPPDQERKQRRQAGPSHRMRTPECYFWSCGPNALRSRADSSSLREPMSSFENTLRRCHSTVRGLRNSSAAISGFERPPRASSAICAS